MEKTFIYWDNSNIFISAQQVAIDREGEAARYRIRIHFRNLLKLACADRPIEHAIAVGSIPPELRHVWNQMEKGAMHHREQGVDQALQTAMLRDAFDYNGDPGIAVMLTGDGAGFDDGVGFHADLERMRRRGWRVEVLSWRHSCNRAMRRWAEQNGTFVALDDHYESVTFLEPPAPGRPLAEPRAALPVDLGRRPS